MNRPLKFRFFNNLENMMYYSDHFVNLYMFFIWAKNTKCKNIQQFTGLHDCDGKEIYEGDVIEYFDPWKKEKLKEVVKIEVSDYSMECVPFNGYFIDQMNMPTPDECKIVGNIFEGIKNGS